MTNSPTICSWGHMSEPKWASECSIWTLLCIMRLLQRYVHISNHWQVSRLCVYVRYDHSVGMDVRYVHIVCMYTLCDNPVIRMEFRTAEICRYEYTYAHTYIHTYVTAWERSVGFYIHTYINTYTHAYIHTWGR
jgi:hypothetical protein